MTQQHFPMDDGLPDARQDDTAQQQADYAEWLALLEQDRAERLAALDAYYAAEGEVRDVAVRWNG